ncbi:MAG: tRNA (adenosine(37)-N6)-threonylcarbamoyltransferase complex transferase subunit TsaD [Omnitrophica bacterium RIFCSPHIGHO2_02_FULL_51_18]|nr:MAG: tRNA (adenosine(37)-N6)-threonylcarbamoyltransferase complex transferase subunit TsaD [Omnitrophica bacterium RIFCSPHIGHO2_02_FULL_51_18]
MITLGIETTCDETSIALVKNGKQVLANVVFSSLLEHKPYGGVVPEIASRAHLETLLPCLEASLKKARLSLKHVGLIAVAQGPGLMGSLLVGLSAAKALALALKKPLIGVDHVIAHLYSAFLSGRQPCLPCLGLVVSGGHTLIIHMKNHDRIQILGKTLDDAAGEAFDKVAKILGLGYPGGPGVDRLSRGEDTKVFPFTRPFLKSDSLDFSFSGIKTAVFYKVLELKKKKPLTLKTKKQICAGFQEAVCEVLVEKTVRAAKSRNLKTVIVGGGVSANSRLREKFKEAERKQKLKVIFPPLELCQDNAAMIAGLGTALYRRGKRDRLELSSYPDFHYLMKPQ